MLDEGKIKEAMTKELALKVETWLRGVVPFNVYRVHEGQTQES